MARANGEGSIYKVRDKSGKITGYRAAYYVHTAKGPKRKYLSGKTRDEVAVKLTKAMADRDGGFVFDAGTVTVEEYLERWLSDSVRDTVRQRTYEGYEHIVERHISPALGGVKLSKLTPAHVRGLYRDKLDAGLSPRTVRYVHTTLNKALSQAVADGLIPRNAAASVKPPQPRKTEIRPLDTEQVRTLLETVSGDRLEALYVVAVTAGLREGELLGLRWEDVDLEAGRIQVRRTASEARTGLVYEMPKSGVGRQVRLGQKATQALRAHRKRQLEERMEKAGLWEDHGLVFPSEVGTPLGARNLQRGFKIRLKRAGLPESTRFHDLRHTCATVLLGQGVNPKFVQELLGHKDIALTLNVYSHVLPDMGDAAAGAMDDALS
ncbi:MAG: site-specific integrase [Rubrobacter sp.]|nr:site-specific integrase [Rubrobacter sp.]